jgi:hypothetical protein
LNPELFVNQSTIKINIIDILLQFLKHQVDKCRMPCPMATWKLVGIPSVTGFGSRNVDTMGKNGRFYWRKYRFYDDQSYKPMVFGGIFSEASRILLVIVCMKSNNHCPLAVKLNSCCPEQTVPFV